MKFFPQIKKPRLVALPLLLLSLLVFFPFTAQAQIFGPRLPGAECKAGTECKVGSYQVRVTFDRDTFNTTDSFVATVERLDKTSADWKLEAESFPDPKTSATPVKLPDISETGDPNKRQVKVYFPISGSWYLHLTLSGSAGKGELRVPARVEAPPKLDEWLAWTIALSPLIGIVGFALGQWRYVVKRRRAEKNLPAASPEQPEEARPVATGETPGI